MQYISVGMSGGVDSAVAASILIEKGYNVEGIFMKNWEDDSQYCTTETDYKDALQACETLGIPLRSVNFSKQYWDRVFKHFLKEYKNGRTPNPDILCNTEIKFKEFLNSANDLGADKIATGHYARHRFVDGEIQLIKGLDSNKDQTYFLYGLNQHQISSAIFPIGDLNKKEVRDKAKKLGLKNFNKKDSVGICFIGERDLKEFLQNYIPAQPGNIISEDGVTIGQHDGLMYYTLGQRKGLGIGGGYGSTNDAWYVLNKHIRNNELIVCQGNKNPGLYHKCLSASQINWISSESPKKEALTAKVRYRTMDIPCRIIDLSDDNITIEFDQTVFAVTPGQSVVFYDGDICLGGAIINTTFN